MKKHKTPIFSIYYNPFDTGLIKTPSKRTKSIMTKLYYLIIFLGVCMLLLCTPATSNAQKKDSTAKEYVMIDSVFLNRLIDGAKNDIVTSISNYIVTKHPSNFTIKEYQDLIKYVTDLSNHEFLIFANLLNKEWMDKHKKKIP